METWTEKASGRGDNITCPCKKAIDFDRIVHSEVVYETKTVKAQDQWEMKVKWIKVSVNHMFLDTYGTQIAKSLNCRQDI